MPKSLELRTERAKLINDARKIHDAADAEKRALTGEEKQEFQRLMDASDAIQDSIRDAERLELAEAALEASQRVTTPDRPGENRVGTDNRVSPLASEEYRTAFVKFVTQGPKTFREADLRAIDAVSNMPEIRSLQADSAVAGGFLVAPQDFIDSVILFVKNLVFMRALGTNYEVTNSGSLGIPALDADPADEDWTSELATGTEDSTMAFGKRELYPRPLAKRIKISRRLLLLSRQAEPLVRDRLAYKFAVTEEKAFMTGSGVQQPLGLFTASGNGISTNQDIQTVSAGVIKADDVIAMKYNLKVQYWNRPSTRFIFHRHTMQMIRLLKDANNQFLWQPSGLGSNLNDDGLDRIVDVPVVMSEYAPDQGTTNSGMTSGKYLGIIGDMKFYYIATMLNMVLQRLDELYAETNQVGFIGRMEIDGMPALEEAFTRLKVQ